VLGRLAITRAFGDFECKNLEISQKDTEAKEVRSFIICEPEIREITLNPETDEFIILASDGLYDRATSQEAITMIRSKLASQNIYEQDP
jgi:protein phosphatase 2C family protein 2/3